MTRCECTDTPFSEVAREVEAQKVTLDDYIKKTGCGGNCTACVPDLKRFLASRQR